MESPYLATMLHSPTTASESTIGFSPLSLSDSGRRKSTIIGRYFEPCFFTWGARAAVQPMYPNHHQVPPPPDFDKSKNYLYPRF